MKKFINEKFKFFFYFFVCILPDYVAHDIAKEFWKNSHFENVTAGFLLRCQKSLRQTTPEIKHFQGWQKYIFTNTAPVIVIVLTKCSLQVKLWKDTFIYFIHYIIKKKIQVISKTFYHSCCFCVNILQLCVKKNLRLLGQPIIICM